MRLHLCLAIGLLSAVFVGPVDALASQTLALDSATSVASEGWIARPSDNICGIADARKISNPAMVDYGTLFEATSEIKEMRRDRIDPDSARGKQLRRAATEAITKAAETVRRSQGHCGVWKAIRHSDRRSVPDITFDVLGYL